MYEETAMYRISQAAELLRVSTAEIHQHIISMGHELEPFIHRNRGIVMISEEGLGLIKAMLQNEDRMGPNRLDNSVTTEGQTRINESETIRSAGDIVRLGDLINQRKNELHRLTLESRRLDEALTHYLKVLKDDVDDRIRSEDEIEVLIRNVKSMPSRVNRNQLDLFDING
jgi:hypothetical protein